MHKHLEAKNDVNFDKIFNQMLGNVLLIIFLSNYYKCESNRQQNFLKIWTWFQTIKKIDFFFLYFENRFF